jgi:hypothetical protein
LGTIAIGVGELVGGVHAQAALTERGAIGIALALRMPMGIEGNGLSSPLGDEGYLYETCSQDHKCGEEMQLLRVKSPRAGVCGYPGQTPAYVFW